MITGWQDIMLFTGLSQQFIAKAMKLYGFPNASRTARQGKALLLAWDKQEVLAWMTANQEMMRTQLESRRRYEQSWR